ncbi:MULTISPECIES: fimbrial protein [Pseudomonas fluorescens group]|uniref:PapH_1 protein n=1 Tax=Pseudomonas fluorescens TaxID=294 RepID=A0A0D0TS60_PSEFL|nr:MULTISPECIES: fimbrial protein [Pseudomonas fluorescens group]AZE62714.1 MrfB [Pseudomonas synxantha]KIR23635.1 PAP fimbrial minor pilin protein precursor [Pseudomonas fluorescens]
MNVLIRLTVASSVIIFASSFFSVRASAQSEGVVGFGGEIIESACGLEVGGADQIVEMPAEPIGRLLRDGQGEPFPFQLRLVNCSLSRPDPLRLGQNLPDFQHVQVTFDGARDRGGLSFTAFGDSQGVALQIVDEFGQESVPGKPMARQPLLAGSVALNYTLRLIGNGLPIVAGTHGAAVRFKLEYF